MTIPHADFSIESLTLPQEEPLEDERLLLEWTAAYPSGSPIERGYLEQAVTALIERRRVGRILATLRTQRVRTAVLEWERAEEDNVDHWMNEFNTHPPTALIGLLRSAAGCRWAIAYWIKLAQELQDLGSWFGESRIAAIQLKGESACVHELFYSEEAYFIWRDCIACQPNPKQEDIDKVLDRKNIPKALRERDVPVWPCDAGECRARLQALADGELARLRVLEATLRVEFEEPSKAEARLMALASISKEETALLRTQRAHDQSYERATTALLRVRKQTAAAPGPGPAAAAGEIASSALILPPRSTPSGTPGPAPPAGDRPVVGGRSEDRSIHGDAITARCSDQRPFDPRTGHAWSRVSGSDRRNL